MEFQNDYDEDIGGDKEETDEVDALTSLFACDWYDTAIQIDQEMEVDYDDSESTSNSDDSDSWGMPLSPTILDAALFDLYHKE